MKLVVYIATGLHTDQWPVSGFKPAQSTCNTRQDPSEKSPIDRSHFKSAEVWGYCRMHDALLDSQHELQINCHLPNIPRRNRPLVHVDGPIVGAARSSIYVQERGGLLPRTTRSEHLVSNIAGDGNVGSQLSGRR